MGDESADAKLSDREWVRREEEANELSKGMSLAAMKALSEAELVRRYDFLAGADRWISTAQEYLDEINRRRTDRATSQLLMLTRVLTALTLLIAILTVVAVYIAVTE